jgi:hypothetical protein
MAAAEQQRVRQKGNLPKAIERLPPLPGCNMRNTLQYIQNKFVSTKKKKRGK